MADLFKQLGMGYLAKPFLNLPDPAFELSVVKGTNDVLNLYAPIAVTCKRLKADDSVAVQLGCQFDFKPAENSRTPGAGGTHIFSDSSENAPPTAVGDSVVLTFQYKNTGGKFTGRGVMRLVAASKGVQVSNPLSFPVSAE